MKTSRWLEWFSFFFLLKRAKDKMIRFREMKHGETVNSQHGRHQKRTPGGTPLRLGHQALIVPVPAKSKPGECGWYPN